MRVRVAVAFTALLVAGCSSSGSGYVERTYRVTPGHVNHPTAIGHGRVGSAAWTLLADVTGDGQLCLGIHWRPSGPAEQYGCGYGDGDQNDEGRGFHPVDTQESASGETVGYGPAPATSVRVVLMPAAETCPAAASVRPLSVAITHRLPSWYGGHGGWFVTPLPPAVAHCYFDAVFRDAAGRVVPQPRNF